MKFHQRTYIYTHYKRNYHYFIRYSKSFSIPVPVGHIICCAFKVESIPGHLPCDGRSLKKKDYPELYQAILQEKFLVLGSKKPEYRAFYGETKTTFNLPDLRVRT
jgi:hypothetical protein